MSFTRMDEGRLRDWKLVEEHVTERQKNMPKRIKEMLLSLETMVDGFPVNQLVHSLQTGSRAFRDGATEEVIVAALCHDIGKVASLRNHEAISAEILRPYVSDDVYMAIRNHTEFQGKHYYALIGKDPDMRRKFVGESWFELAQKITDEWDQTSFDPNYDTLPLSFFEPMIDRIFAEPRKDSSGHSANFA